MKKLFLLFSHNITPEQIKDAKTTLCTDEIHDLPKNLKELWSTVNPYEYTIPRLDIIKTFLLKNSIPEGLCSYSRGMGLCL